MKLNDDAVKIIGDANIAATMGFDHLVGKLLRKYRTLAFARSFVHGVMLVMLLIMSFLFALNFIQISPSNLQNTRMPSKHEQASCGHGHAKACRGQGVTEVKSVPVKQ